MTRLCPIREGRGLLTGPASKGQVPDPRSAFLLTKGAVQVNPMGYTNPKMHQLRIPLI